MTKNTSPMDKKYISYYQSIMANEQKSDIQFVILTHVVSDVVAFIKAIDEIGEISLIVSIPYSEDRTVFQQFLEKYKVLSPDLNALLDPNYLSEITLENIDPNRQLIIIEIGGYFAPAISSIDKKINGNLVGVVEDTEAGHRKYETMNENLPCPVLSVARSHLKDAENFLVASSCMKATDSILSSFNSSINIRNALVLGYGRIGQGICQLLGERNIPVSIYDSDPAKRLLALSRGYPIPEKKEAIIQADIIFGATGAQSITAQDIVYIKNDACLFSCSSKRIEFDLKYVKEKYVKTQVNLHVDKYEYKKHYFYVAGDGQPINFACGKILVGPIISIVHGEMLAAISELSSFQYKNKVQEIPKKRKMILAKSWINTFCDTQTGNYLYE